MGNLNPIFVFGTLKSGFPNHHYLNGKTCLGTHTTLHSYQLFLVGERHSPWMIERQGQGEKVQGEVYLVDNSTLDELDQLERVNFEDGYQRQSIQVEKHRSGAVMDAWTYLKNPLQLSSNLIKAGPLVEYQLQHARLYRKRNSVD
jgi:gamma-glutamylaminecyclotransferase